MFLLTVFLLLTGVSVWTMAAEGQAHYAPDYEREDLEPFLGLEREKLTEDDYQRLFMQTGLAKAGVDELYEAGRQEQLLDLQERFFADVEVECRHVNLLLRSERLVKKEGIESEEKQGTASNGINGVMSRGVRPEWEVYFPVVQDGDILVTFSGHVFGWRSGHAAIVVKASEGQTLEAVAYGCDSAVCSVEHWGKYPCFALLRLKGITRGQQADISEYAMAEFVDVPYSLFAFTDSGMESGQDVSGNLKESAEGVSDEGNAVISATQCAHLVWAVYRHFGYDLNSDGGAVVTPADIFFSDLLEVVQIYGIDPQTIIADAYF